MKRILTLFLFAAAAAGCGRTAQEAALIPAAKSVEYASGSYVPASPAGLYIGDERFAAAETYLREAFAPETAVVAAERGEAAIRILNDPALTRTDEYRLDITRSGIEISAAGYGGVTAAIATLRQLRAQGALPYCRIEDYARFPWRGFMLDVARHFYTKEEVMRFVDYAALYKLNKFHWHLTDDQGWRIEIDAYPELTQQEAWREPNNHDIECLRRAEALNDPTYRLPETKIREVNGKRLYGGFYTKDEIREVIAYAAVRGIDIIPEIDMPGHSQRAISAYPSLSCFGKASWGSVFSAPLCVGRDATLEFCRNVYKELFELFPYEYVHAGGDEVEKDNWEKCLACQARIRRLGLHNEKELQSWFIHQMADFFRENGKRLIGWDEIEEGGLVDNETVMWWRNWTKKSFYNAVARGNEVIVSTNEFFYLDAEQSRNTLKKVYEFDLDAMFDGNVPEQIIGMQGHLWCEFIPSFERAGYRVFPRLLAIAEQAWGKPGTDYPEFEQRVYSHLQTIFDRDGMNYRIPDMNGYCDHNVFKDKVRISLKHPLPGVQIRYTTDGTVPGPDSPLYDGELELDETTQLNLRCYTPNGIGSEYIPLIYTKTGYRPAEEKSGLQEGLHAVWYDYTGEACTEIDRVAKLGEFTVPTIAIPEGAEGNIGLVFTGYIEVPEDGVYSFYLNSDDGSVFRIGDYTVIDNDGPHSRLERTGQAALCKGLHPVEARYFDHNGGVLEFGIIDSEGRRLPIPESIRFYSEPAGK